MEVSALSVSTRSGYGRVAAATAGYGDGGQLHATRHAAAIDRSFFGPRHLPRRAAIPADDPGKRLFDIVMSLALLVLLAPLIAAVVLVILGDGGAVFYGHRRIGAGGASFTCWKFRTMVPNATELLAEILADDPQARLEWEQDFKLRSDPRITRAGKFLRLTSLDELPQLFNVLKGEMSLVGPRPIVGDEVARYGAAFHDYARCRPGITGIWQVSGRNDTDYATRVRLDQRYARTRSLALDCLVLVLTARVVVRRRGAY
jgi:undecaprenyl-phosphate galactose phosphotransferase